MSSLIPRLRLNPSLTRPQTRTLSHPSTLCPLPKRSLSLLLSRTSFRIPAAAAPPKQTQTRSAHSRYERTIKEDPESSKCLFIGRLPRDADDEDLRRVFKKFGKVTKVKIARDGLSQSRGFAHVQFQNEAEAVAAHKAHQSAPISINGSTVRIGFAEPFAQTKDHQEQEEPKASRRLYLGMLRFEVSEQDLMKVFGRYGELDHVYISRYEDNRSRGFGFIRFVEEKNAVAVRKLHDTKPFVFGGVPIKLKFAVQQITSEVQEPKSSKRLYLGGLPLDVDDADLLKTFGRFGKTRVLRISRNEYDKSTGVGFVEYLDEKVAVAVRELHEKKPFTFGGVPIKVKFTIAPPKQ